MRDAFPVLIFFAILVIAATGIIWAVLQQQQQTQTLERIAARFRGRLEAGSLFLRGQVRLRFLGYPALLKYVKHGKNSTHTTFSITWPERPFRLEVYPQDILSGFRRLWGMEDIEIGSAEFDRSFYISGNSRAAVREMLSSEVQALIWKLANLGPAKIYGARDVQVQFLGGVLTITTPRYLNSYEQLEEFVTLSAELFQAAMRTRDAGIGFVGTGPADAGEPDAVESRCGRCSRPRCRP
jgi:hypothetical protein